MHEGEESWFETIDEVVFTQKHKIYNWMKEVENDHKSVKYSRSSENSSGRSSKGSSHSSRSNSSKNSCGRTSIEAIALEEKLKMAELLAEVSFTEKKHAAILNAEEIGQKEELAKLKARTQILEEIKKNDYPVDVKMGVDKDNIKHLTKKVHTKKVPAVSKEKQKKLGMSSAIPEDSGEETAFKTEKNEKYSVKLNPDAPPFFTSANVTKREDIYGLLNDMIEQQAAPDIEMEYFDGNPLEYHHFIDLFREVVEKWVQDPKGRLLRLLKYKRGEAHDLIKHCLQEPSYTGYSHAQGLFRKRYGDPHTILASYRKEVRNWPKLKFGDGKEFRVFCNFLVKCDGVARQHCWNAINTPDILCMLLSKLPNGIIDRWNRTAYSIYKNHECEPSLSNLIEFVDQEKTLVNDSTFSQEAIGIFSGKSEKSLERKSRKIKTMATETAVEKCPFCGGNHDVEQCEDFKKSTVNERSKTFFRKRLCYGCCKPISDG